MRRAVGLGEPVKPRSFGAVQPEVGCARDLGGDPVEGVVADREEGAPQGAGQRDPIERILDGGQGVDDVQDFLLGEETRAADDVSVDRDKILGKPLSRTLEFVVAGDTFTPTPATAKLLKGF